MKDFAYLKSYTTFSLRKSVNKPDDLIKTAKSYGASAIAVTELGNVFSAVKIAKAAKKHKIKPIVGCNLYIQDEILSNITILCKNLNGWKSLLQIISKSNLVDNFNLSKELPTISLTSLKELLSKDFIVYTGSLFSWLPTKLVTNYNEFVQATTYDTAKSLVSPDWKSLLDKHLNELIDVVGKENIRVEIQNIDNKEFPAADIIYKIMQWGAKQYSLKTIPTCRPHYLKPESAQDQKILICVDKKTTLQHIDRVLADDVEYLPFFRNNAAYLLSGEEYSKYYSEAEIENTMEVVSHIEDFDIGGKPKLPVFDCGGQDPDNYFRELCHNNLRQMYQGVKLIDYQARLDEELNTLIPIGLSSYFLIVHDIVKYCNSHGWLISSRGSVGGCLIANVLGISECDPIKYGLIFSRFYNAGRNSADNISLPDIDLDLMSQYRKDVISYIRDKYGFTKTSNIATFGGLEGASALKEVLRIKSRCSTAEQNEITKLIIKKDKISDELEELRQAGEEASIIGWSLDNIKELAKFAYYDDNGELSGEYGNDFAQAIRIESCKRNMGKHPCGILISSVPLVEYCPMVFDKKNAEHQMCGFEKPDIEYAGGLKMDVLGVSSISDIHETINLIRNGDFVHEQAV